MARLIDADALREMFPEDYDHPLHHFTGIWAAIGVCPTIDAAPVRRGEWERYNLTALGTGIEWYRLRCSECKLMPVGEPSSFALASVLTAESLVAISSRETG